MKAYTELLNDVMPDLPGADVPMVLHAIKRVCADFYDRSLIGRETLAAVAVQQGVAAYTVAPADPNNFTASKVLSVQLQESVGIAPRVLEPRSQHDLNALMPGWNTSQGRPTAYTQTAMATIILAKIPDAPYTPGLLVTIARAPLYDGAGIDDDVMAGFVDALASGVKARMMLMAKKPWTNPQLGAMHASEFEQEIGAASTIAARSFGAGRLRTRPFA